MVDISEQQLSQLLKTVQQSAKYKHVDPDLIRSLGSQELAKRTNLKTAIKSTKNKLHQIGGAYWYHKTHYAKWLNELEKVLCLDDPQALRGLCASIMASHTSTQERLSILETFYTQIFAALPPVRSILDLACGLNPLAIPWMPLTESTHYYACDIYQDTIEFLNQFMCLIDRKGQAEVCDIIQTCPTHAVDVAFVFKTLPCLEQIQPLAGIQLLEKINAPIMLVSFPVRSLTGKNKGMSTHYEFSFRQKLQEKKWSIERLEFPTELVFLIEK